MSHSVADIIDCAVQCVSGGNINGCVAGGIINGLRYIALNLFSCLGLRHKVDQQEHEAVPIGRLYKIHHDHKSNIFGSHHKERKSNIDDHYSDEWSPSSETEGGGRKNIWSSKKWGLSCRLQW